MVRKTNFGKLRDTLASPERTRWKTPTFYIWASWCKFVGWYNHWYAPMTPYKSYYRDTVIYGTALTWTLLLPVWKVFTTTRNQMFASDTSEIRFNLAWSFIRSSIFYRKPLFEQTLTHRMTLFLTYLVKNSIQRNINRRGKKRVCAGREKSPSFTKITKERNQ